MKERKTIFTKATHIVWDTENDGEIVPQEELGLPSEVEIPKDVEADDVADYLSDEYGYCVKSFLMEP